MNNCDLLIIGSGAAGLYAALCLPKTWRVALITKESLEMGASDWAQGGIAAAVDPQDSPLLHLKDTLKAGAGLCETEAVEFLVKNAPQAIANLVEMGVAFDRQGDRLALTLEAAHSRPRVLHAADTTGRAIVHTLREKVLQRSNIRVISQALALKLWLDPVTGKCQGASILQGQRIDWIAAKAVILATGGGGQVFSQTTNPNVSTGDGVALAWRAGAVLRDLEFFQFHPTALTKAGAPRFLISEAVRGEGAHLIDSQGERFAFQYHPDGELAPRDVVSRAIFNHLQKTAEGNVYLDLRPIPPEQIRHRFPNIIGVCQEWGIDVFSQPIPVTPAAHYWMGGIAVDTQNRSSIEGLYAIGEVASTGVHGANRLASNSLLECLVYAAELGRMALPQDDRILIGKELAEIKREQVRQVTEIPTSELAELQAIRVELPDLVWQSAGICRSRDILTSAIVKVTAWHDRLLAFPMADYLLQLTPATPIEFGSVELGNHCKLYAETLNLVEIANLILKSANFREESRGGHYRLDYPHTSPDWQVHTLVTNNRCFRSDLL
jgi:L-aspartate oxidase